MADARPTLFVMVRAPVAGRVKTRLARSIGPAEAVRFYRAATNRLLRRVGRDRRWRTILAVTPDAATHSRFWPASMTRVAQGGGDLGARMQRLLDHPMRGPVLIVGSDIPSVSADHVATACRLVRRHPVVVGPATDGGYWLIGARRRPRTPSPFHDVRWSTADALADALRNCPPSVGRAATLSDVDTEAEWREWRRTAASLMVAGAARSSRPRKPG
jgi:rSAM/selenodomain-associated transferase 1